MMTLYTRLKILLVGDVAGLVNPFFGDGILHAIKSGTIAAECIIDRVLDQYTQRLHAELAANFDAALQLSDVFYSDGTVRSEQVFKVLDRQQRCF